MNRFQPIGKGMTLRQFREFERQRRRDAMFEVLTLISLPVMFIFGWLIVSSLIG